MLASIHDFLTTFNEMLASIFWRAVLEPSRSVIDNLLSELADQEMFKICVISYSRYLKLANMKRNKRSRQES